MGSPFLDVSASKRDGYVKISPGLVRGGACAPSVGMYDFQSSQVLSVYGRIFGVVRLMRPVAVK